MQLAGDCFHQPPSWVHHGACGLCAWYPGALRWAPLSAALGTPAQRSKGPSAARSPLGAAHATSWHQDRTLVKGERGLEPVFFFFHSTSFSSWKRVHRIF